MAATRAPNLLEGRHELVRSDLLERGPLLDADCSLAGAGLSPIDPRRLNNPLRVDRKADGFNIDGTNAAKNALAKVVDPNDMPNRVWVMLMEGGGKFGGGIRSFVALVVRGGSAP